MPDPFSGGDSLVNVLASMGQTQEMFQRSQQDGATPGITVNTEMGPEGTTHSIELGDADLRTILGTIKNYGQVVDAYQKEISRLDQQQQRLQQNPILNVLATVGGATAMQDKRLPPIVRALGEASQKLNPTYNELEDRKLGVLGRLGDITSRAATLGEAASRTAEQRREFDVGEKRRQQEEERRLAMDQRKIQHEDAMAEFARQKEEANERMRQAALDSAERREAERDRTLIEGKELTERAMMERFEKGQEAAAKKTEKKETEVPKTTLDKLSNLSAAEKSLDNIDAVIDKYGKYMGQVAGRTVAPVTAYFKKDIAQAQANLKLEVAQAIQATGAGARGFGPQERGFFEKLATAMTHSPEENKGIVNAWRQYIQQKRGAELDVHKGLSDPKYRKALGKDADSLLGADEETTGDPVLDAIKKHAGS